MNDFNFTDDHGNVLLQKDSSALTMEFCIKPLIQTWVISFQKVCLGDESTWFIWNTICLENNWVTDRLYVEAGQHISFDCMHQDLQGSTGIHNCIIINPSCDEFKLRKIKKIYVHFQSFLNIEMAQVVGTLPHEDKDPFIPYCHYLCCWWSYRTRSQASYAMVLTFLAYNFPVSLWVSKYCIFMLHIAGFHSVSAFYSIKWSFCWYSMA